MIVWVISRVIQLLIATARTLETCLRPMDTVARLVKEQNDLAISAGHVVKKGFETRVNFVGSLQTSSPYLGSLCYGPSLLTANSEK